MILCVYSCGMGGLWFTGDDVCVDVISVWLVLASVLGSSSCGLKRESLSAALVETVSSDQGFGAVVSV